MADLIDRQAAIDAIVNTVSEIGLHDNSEVARYGATFRQHEIIDIIESFPSVQSETNCSEIPNNSDCISRQAAIDVEGLDEQIRCEMCVNPMHTDRGCDGNCRYNENLYKRIMQTLDERIKPLPPAQPERIKGRWISADAMFHGVPFYCSNCGENTRDTVMGKPRWNFCPNCGADMRQREE